MSSIFYLLEASKLEPAPEATGPSDAQLLAALALIAQGNEDTIALSRAIYMNRSDVVVLKERARQIVAFLDAQIKEKAELLKAPEDCLALLKEQAFGYSDVVLQQIIDYRYAKATSKGTWEEYRLKATALEAKEL